MKKKEFNLVDTKKNIISIVAFCFVFFSSQQIIFAHDNFEAKYIITEQKVIIDKAELTEKDIECILNDTTCSLISKIISTKQKEIVLYVSEDTRDDAIWEANKQCEEKHKPFEKSTESGGRIYIIRRFKMISIVEE